MTEHTSNRMDSHRFAGEVGAGGDADESTTVEADATVEEVAVRFYPGPRLDLHVTPYLERGNGANANRIPLVNFHGKDYVDGDDDLWVFPISEPVEQGDTLGVFVNNTEPEHAYDYAVNMTLDREAGVQRSASSLLGRLGSAVSGVF